MFAIKVQSSLPDWSIDIEQDFSQCGNIIGVFGKSGHGKSTFLKSLAGLESHSEYCLTLGQHVYSNLPPEFSPCVLNRQRALLFPHLNVIDNLNFVVKHSKWRTFKSRSSVINIEQVVDWFGLDDLLEHTVNQLSGGEQQRVALARSLLSGKPIILLDEPFSALDWQGRIKLIERLRVVVDLYPVRFIFVSHSLKELALVTDYLLHIEQGKVISKGRTQAMIRQMNITNVHRDNSSAIFAQLHLKFGQVLEQHQLSQWYLPSDENKPQQFIFIKENLEDMFFVNKEYTQSNYRKRITIDAKQISLSRYLNKDTSMLNWVQAKVVHIIVKPYIVLVTLEVEGQTLFSQISKLSLETLNLTIGETVYAVFKAL